jgi:hypothetical protein
MMMSDPRDTVALPRRVKGRDDMNQTAAGHQTGGHQRSARAQARAAQAARLETTVVVVLLIVFAVCVFLVSATNPTIDTRTTQVITVGQSDSLWELARAHPVQGANTADVVRMIAEVNHLESSTVVPGQRLVVPARDDRMLLAVR